MEKKLETAVGFRRNGKENGNCYHGFLVQGLDGIEKANKSYYHGFRA